MKKSASFKNLDCWKEARLLTTHIYCISKDVCVAKDWDYDRQIRKASISIMNNISEGFGRFTPKTFIQFLNYSLGSCSEVESMVIIGNDLGYIPDEDAEWMEEKCRVIRAKTINLMHCQRGKL